ncbi:site-specific DNA-methyltransferase [bacterium]|nr:site-specific DNA-methyltransferase [bacterium]
MSAFPPTRHSVRIGDARAVLPSLPGGSVQLVVTSPPYWSIKDYDHKDQIGSSESYESYLDSLAAVWRECHRVLEPGCKLVINVGDQFVRGTRDADYHVKPIQADTIAACRALGFACLGSIIWRKMTTTRTTGGCVWMGSIYYPRDGYVTYEHEYIMLFRKSGKARPPAPALKQLSKLTKHQRSLWFRGMWDLAPARQNGHCAMFPYELPERLIRMFTFAGDTVLDPFAGSGTTLEAACDFGRNSIGIELNPRFLPLILDRLGVPAATAGSDIVDPSGNSVRITTEPPESG